MADELRTYGLANGPRVDELTDWDDEPLMLTLAQAQRYAERMARPLMVRVDGEWVEA